MQMYSGKGSSPGPPSPECNSLRAVITKGLKYADEAEILQQFRKTKTMEIEKCRLLLFANYFLEVSCKRKRFTQVCVTLHSKRIKLTLAYHAILHVQEPSGEQLTFTTQMETKSFKRSFKATPPPKSSPSRSKTHQK